MIDKLIFLFAQLLFFCYFCTLRTQKGCNGLINPYAGYLRIVSIHYEYFL